MTDERCIADFLDATLDCELPPGHEGDHQCTFTWPQVDRDFWIGASAAVAGGYLAYLQHKYAHASGS